MPSTFPLSLEGGKGQASCTTRGQPKGESSGPPLVLGRIPTQSHIKLDYYTNVLRSWGGGENGGTGKPSSCGAKQASELKVTMRLLL